MIFVKKKQITLHINAKCKKLYKYYFGQTVGKSTIVNHFKDPEERSQVTLPTVGFNVEKFQSEWLKQEKKINRTFSMFFKLKLAFNG